MPQNESARLLLSIVEMTSFGKFGRHLKNDVRRNLFPVIKSDVNDVMTSFLPQTSHTRARAHAYRVSRKMTSLASYDVYLLKTNDLQNGNDVRMTSE